MFRTRPSAGRETVYRAPIPRERRHTLYFLEEIRPFVPVFLDTEIDMSRVLEHRAAARAAGRTYSFLTYVVFTSARVIARHPYAGAAVVGRRRLRLARCPEVHVKLTLDKTINGQRVVLSAVLPAVDRAALGEVQELVRHYAYGDPETMPEFAGLRALHRVPIPIGRRLFRRAVRPARARYARFGTLAVTSLGRRPVDGFHSVGGTTVTLGVGRVTQRAVVREGAVVAAPIMRLNLAFDHRVIDGAEAADVLAEIKEALEGFTDPEDDASLPPEVPSTARPAAGRAPGAP